MARRLPERTRARAIAIALALVGVIGAGAAAFAASRRAGAPSTDPRRHALVLGVPRPAGAITIGGETDDPGWRGPVATTGLFASADGRPVTDSSARILWDHETLYILLYAADSDIRATVTAPDQPLWPEDAFRLRFQRADEDAARVLYVSPLGTVNDAFVRGTNVDPAWQSYARVSHDLDGTPNDARDDDEEWVIEMAIPLASLGLRGEPGERIGFSIGRCDTPRGGSRGCAGWGESNDTPGELVLE